MSWVENLARPDIVALKAYEHAAWEPSLERLHANELPWRSPGDTSMAGLNRYPEPQPRALVERLAALYHVEPDSILLGRGSDEAIDLLIRTFCRAGRDRVLICPPTFGMYSVSARIQDAEVLAVPLLAQNGFALDEQAVLERCAAGVKILFLCSPNNPTGNLLDEHAILRLARALEGKTLIVVNEAYVEFSGARSLAAHVASVPHLAVLRTLSKAYALAGARCGALIADRTLIALLRKVIPPYAIAQLTVEAVLGSLEPARLSLSGTRIAVIRAERARLQMALSGLNGITRVWPSEANFVLAQLSEPDTTLTRLRNAGLLVRDVRAQPGLERCVRITVGTATQNDRMLEALR